MSDLMDKLQKLYTVDRHAPHVVICGSLRAGTTLLRLLLSGHSELFELGEADFLFDKRPADDAGPEEVEAWRKRVAAERSAKLQKFEAPKGDSYAEMLDDLLGQYPMDKPRLILTLHRHYDDAAKMLPNAIFIRLQRDPRDVALSSVAMGWGGVPYFGVWPWIEAERDWLAARDHIAPERQHFVRYEDFVANPREELGRILEVSGLPFEESVLDPGEGSSYSPPKAREKEAFRKRLSLREIAEINSRVNFSPEDYGYNLTPAVPPRGFRKLQLTVAGKLKRQQFRINRHGLPLVLKAFAGKWLGMRKMGADAAVRIEENNLKHLK
ncbi:sulfotransferase [Parvularcula sp. ZS-1/3]|uniref:Sulfotransferase n=1 Tax=Parvularcula mediterranea TaxID=2732508 RepID=A0A7Y3W430_9PROT|nr:sulfotransferase [Parvularcula mediterranea]NNU14827.1 sulfotransferase [Parvularcula mediterranea]